MSNPSLERAYEYAAQLQRNAAALPRYIRRSELRQIVPLSDTTIWELERRNEFPRRIVLMPRVVVWDLAEIEGWVKQRRMDTESGKAQAAKVEEGQRKRRPIRRRE